MFTCLFTCSTFRQVPDNQEVFANAQTDQCVIVELLQYESGVRDEESARFFFNEIASSNGCSPADASVLHEELLSTQDGPVAIAAEHVNSVVVGDQRVAKFKEGESAKNVVRVYLCNIRCVCVCLFRMQWALPTRALTRCVCAMFNCRLQTAERDDRRRHLGLSAAAHQPS